MGAIGRNTILYGEHTAQEVSEYMTQEYGEQALEYCGHHMVSARMTYNEVAYDPQYPHSRAYLAHYQRLCEAHAILRNQCTERA